MLQIMFAAIANLEIEVANNLKEAKAKLLKDMKRTKGVRFNASRRLEAREKATTRNIAYASAAVIVVTLLPAFFPLNAISVAAIALMTVGLSIFILATTLLHSSNLNALKADQFHRCALEVNALRRELLSSGEDADIEKFAQRYDDILGRYNINHDDVDYDRYRLEHPDEFAEIDKVDVSTARKNVTEEDVAWSTISNRIVSLTLIVVVMSLLSLDGPLSVFSIIAKSVLEKLSFCVFKPLATHPIPLYTARVPERGIGGVIPAV